MNPYEDIRDMSHVALEDPYDMEQWNTFNLDAPPRAGLYECIVMDPPWNIPLAQSKTAYSRYAKALGKGRHKDEYLAGVADELPYDTMTQNQLLKMPIERWAAPNCHLLIWCTRGTMNDASHLMRHYGFRELTTLAWNKKGGMCNWRIHQNIDYIKYGIRGAALRDAPAQYAAHAICGVRHVPLQEAARHIPHVARALSGAEAGRILQAAPRRV